MMTHSSTIQDISFRLVQESDFPKLFEWLERPHFKKWYESNLIDSTYQNEDGKFGDKPAPIQSFWIDVKNSAIGLIQVFPVFEQNIQFELPQNTSKINFYLNENQYLEQGFGPEILKKFLKEYIFPLYRYVYVEPEIANEKLVQCFQKSGFSVLKKIKKKFVMIAFRQDIRLPIKDLIELEQAFKLAFLPQDKLFIFGSRAHLNQLGGDIDIYIETHAKNVDEAMKFKSIFLKQLFKKIEDQKIDIVMNILSLSSELPIYQIAKEEGIQVC